MPLLPGQSMQRLLVGLIVGLVAPPTQTTEPNLAAPGSMEPRPGPLRHCGPSLVQSQPQFRYAAGGTQARGLDRRRRASRGPTHPAGVVALTRPLFVRPYGVAVARNGTTYVALIGTNWLLRGNLKSGNFTEPVGVGSTPPHVVINPVGTHAYATLQNGRAVAVVDVAANALLATVPLTSDGFNLALAPDGERVYATTAAGTLYVLDATSYAVLDTLNVGPAANGLAFSPDQCTLYVTSRDAGTVTAVSTSSHTITRTYHLGGMPQRIAIAPDGSEIYVANEQSGLNVVNIESGAATSVLFGTAAYGVGLTPDGKQLYVLLPAAGEVRILDRATRASIQTLWVGGTPRNITFDWRGTTALVTTEEAVVFIE
jgi:YVTN family beta-propeller protein